MRNTILRKNNGITLIALVVTIIVLIILAGISLNLVLGQNGIIQRAKDAKVQQMLGEVKEEINIKIAGIVSQKEGDGITDEELGNILKDYGNVNRDEEDEFIVSLTIPGIENEILVEDIYAGEIVRNIKPSLSKLGISNTNIGDYIDLGNNIIKTGSTADDWRVLYVDTVENKVYAILAEYLPSAQIPITSIIGLCGGYNVNVIGFQSPSQFVREYLLNESVWSKFTNGIKGATAVGAPTPTLFGKSYSEKNGTNITIDSGVALTGNLYVNQPGLVRETPTSTETDSFWIAGVYSGNDNYTLRVKQGYVSTANKWNDGVALRPVVSLPLKTKAEKNGNIWTITQENL